ncbi:MAG: hypothetical protein IJF19_02405 [Clostridia bacterium]|nr:hypothetical protein [Clostridia bacterium]
MKKVVSLLIAVLLLACAVVSVSAEISPTAPTIVKDTIIVDAIVVPDNAGSVEPSIDNPFEYEVNSDGTVKLVASSMEGFKFSHWEFITGEFDIIEGSLTSPTLVIKPKGDSNIRAYANFVKEDADTTEPDSKPAVKPDDDDKSPTTGDITPVVVVSAVVLLAGIAAVVLKKKAC